MSTKEMKLSTVMFLYLVLIVSLSCRNGGESTINGDILGKLVTETKNVSSLTEVRDEWPCDTTVYICLYKSGLLVTCIREVIAEGETTAPFDDVPDTISYYFGKLPDGDYTVAFYCTEPSESTSAKAQPFTWYRDDIDSTGFVTDIKKAQKISILGNQKVALQTIKFENYVK